MALEKDDILKFTRSREFLFEKFVGQGGTGQTALIRDDILDTYFICKKYEPEIGNDKIDCFNRFIDEIKILYQLYHPNVVRIYTYFLYPKETTGYILMEYIEGMNIKEYLYREDGETFEKVFIQLIEGFDYLEKASILHRDIKPYNILVTNDGVVKIIDFGFGKRVIANNNEEASILLNWAVSQLPQEVSQYKYDHKTDIYFLGKMFDELLRENGIDDFKYQSIIDNMTLTNPQDRTCSFSEILNLISSDILNQINFKQSEKDVYNEFATSLLNHLSHYTETPLFETNSEVVIDCLERILIDSSLEDYIQNNEELIGCFINSNYRYYTNHDIEVECVNDFYKLLKSKPKHLRKIVLNNLIARLKTISVEIHDDDIPF